MMRSIVAARAVRGFADGFVSVVLAQYLLATGLSPFQVGAIVTATLTGSAVLTIAFGLLPRSVSLRARLLAASVVMAATGVGFLWFTSFLLLLIVGALGTLNPTGGDVSVFLPTEQATIASFVPAPSRAHAFAVYNVAGTLAGAAGALASGTSDTIARALDRPLPSIQRGSFGMYAAAAVVLLLLYRSVHVTREGPTDPASRVARVPPRIVTLAALFSLDSAGSGFVGTSILVLWLHLRFHLSAGSTAAVFFATGLLGGCSQLFAPRVARRLGLVRAMVWTHLPANALLIAAGLAPDVRLAVGLLMVRSLFAQMDSPMRQSFVMSLVPADQRAAAASVTNVPRSLAAACTPIAAGALLGASTWGWPLVIGGLTKIAYDLTLLRVYGRQTSAARQVTAEVSGWP
jgi:MFS family permease